VTGDAARPGSPSGPADKGTPETSRSGDHEGAGPGEFHAACRREGDFWTIAHGGHTARLRDAKGLQHLQTLLRYPGREFHVLELESGPLPAEGAGLGGGGAGAAGRMAAAGLFASRGGDAGEILDPEARSAYRGRLAELEVELANARAAADAEQAEAIEREIEFLNDELSRGFGLGGRSRKAASPAERARLNVSRSVIRCIRRIAEANPALGRHLSASIKTGTYCSYSPDPGLAVRWDL